MIPEKGMVDLVPSTLEIEQQLRGSGLRVTRPRMAVLTAVHDSPHADTNSIIELVRDDLGEVSHQTVYDGLRALTEAGLVRHIQPPGSLARYETQLGDNHHHVVCRECGAIADIDCAVGNAPCMSVPDAHGFVIDETEVIHRGLCPKCSSADSSDPNSPRKVPSV
ncbi:MAG: Fur family transcriptional regulator [Solirubrobacterales bacterium]